MIKSWPVYDKEQSFFKKTAVSWELEETSSPLTATGSTHMTLSKCSFGQMISKVCIIITLKCHIECFKVAFLPFVFSTIIGCSPHPQKNKHHTTLNIPHCLTC